MTQRSKQTTAFPANCVSRLTDDQLIEARAMVKMGLENKDIAEQLGVKTSSVWKSLDELGYREKAA